MNRKVYSIFTLIVALALAVGVVAALAGCQQPAPEPQIQATAMSNTPIRFELGGKKLVIGKGGTVEVQSGGALSIQSGGALSAPAITLTNQISASSIALTLDLTARSITATGTLSTGAATHLGALNMTNNVINNIGNAGSDFDNGGGLTLAEEITATGAVIGGGYGSSGCTMGSDGTLQCNGLATLAGGADLNATTLLNIGNAGSDFDNGGGLTLAEEITATGAVIGGGFGYSGCTISSVGDLQCDGVASLYDVSTRGITATGTFSVTGTSSFIAAITAYGGIDLDGHDLVMDGDGHSWIVGSNQDEIGFVTNNAVRGKWYNSGLNITGTLAMNSQAMSVGKIISGTVGNNGTIAHGLSAAPTYGVCSAMKSGDAPFTATVSISMTNATNVIIGIADPVSNAPYGGANVVVNCYMFP